MTLYVSSRNIALCCISCCNSKQRNQSVRGLPLRKGASGELSALTQMRSWAWALGSTYIMCFNGHLVLDWHKPTIVVLGREWMTLQWQWQWHCVLLLGSLFFSLCPSVFYHNNKSSWWCIEMQFSFSHFKTHTPRRPHMKTRWSSFSDSACMCMNTWCMNTCLQMFPVYARISAP